MSESERLRRWRLVLGGGPADGTRQGPASPFSAAHASMASMSKSWTFTPRSTA